MDHAWLSHTTSTLGVVVRNADGALAEAPPSAWSDADLWDREYSELCAIPSSYRTSPSHSFRRLEAVLKPFPGASVLDAGSGTGRHALYLARQGCFVHAVDASGAACEVLRDRAGSVDDLRRRITVEQAHLEVDAPPDARYDIVIDSYVSCHLLNDDARRCYLSGLRRLLRPGGALYTACMGADDEYYAAHATDPAGPFSIATDPLNGVAKLLQPRLLFRDGLSEFSRVEAVTTERFDDVVAGQTYGREVLAAVVRT